MKEFSLHPTDWNRSRCHFAPGGSVDYAKRSPRNAAKMNTRVGIQQWTAFFVQHNLTIGTLDR
jgi:hypothetical protein